MDIEVQYWAKTKIGKKVPAIIYAECIVKQYKTTTVFLLCNGQKFSIKNRDIVSVTRTE